MGLISKATAELEAIASTIVVVRAHRVLLDADLAALYGVPTKALNQAVRRNSARFPSDFVFRITEPEHQMLNRSQIVTGSQKHRSPRLTPFAFTEHGTIMAASVLNTPRAVEMSVYIVRAFVQLRTLLVTNAALARQLDALERKYKDHDAAIAAMLATIRVLMNEPTVKSRGIGCTADLKPGK